MPVARILAFDTSANATAVAVVCGERVFAEHDDGSTPGRHAETLLPRIERCLAASSLALGDLDLIAVGIGPGSFTGVRVGIATAKGLALATGTPVRGVVSLASLAVAALEHPPLRADVWVVPILDAHKGEVFAAVYAPGPEGGVREIVPAFHGAPADVAARLRALTEGRALRVLGSGVRRYPEPLAALLAGGELLPEPADEPSAVFVAREAERLLRVEGASDLVSLAPLYLRGSDAQLPKTPLRLG
jgi:tRNA threonylcarbamoyladenosine biosynthesis protein TsaB